MALGQFTLEESVKLEFVLPDWQNSLSQRSLQSDILKAERDDGKPVVLYHREEPAFSGEEKERLRYGQNPLTGNSLQGRMFFTGDVAIIPGKEDASFAVTYNVKLWQMNEHTRQPEYKRATGAYRTEQNPLSSTGVIKYKHFSIEEATTLLQRVEGIASTARLQIPQYFNKFPGLSSTENYDI